MDRTWLEAARSRPALAVAGIAVAVLAGAALVLASALPLAVAPLAVAPLVAPGSARRLRVARQGDGTADADAGAQSGACELRRRSVTSTMRSFPSVAGERQAYLME